jgi:hypothetical protein
MKTKLGYEIQKTKLFEKLVDNLYFLHNLEIYLSFRSP